MYRVKRFSRTDKKVYKELYKATNGFRDIPEGYQKLIPRDTYRATSLTRGINKAWETGDLSGINQDELSTLATHLGLPETAANGKRLLKKITNPELQKRYLRMQKHKSGLVKYEEARNLWDNDVRTKTIQDAVNNNADKVNEYVSRSEARLSRRLRNHSKEIQDSYKKLNATLSTLTQEDIALNKKLEDYTQKNKIVRYKNPEANIHQSRMYYNPNPAEEAQELGMIETGVKYTPEVLAHENGHFIHSKKIKGKFKGSLGEMAEIDYGPDNLRGSINNLSNEYGANVRGLQLLRKQGASKRQLQRAKENYLTQYKTYINNTAQNISDDLHNKLHNI